MADRPAHSLSGGPAVARPAFAAFFPALFVVLWSTGFIAAKYGLPYAPPLTFLVLRFGLVAALMTLVAFVTRAVSNAVAGQQFVFVVDDIDLAIEQVNMLEASRAYGPGG